jgi:hypothetical protein
LADAVGLAAGEADELRDLGWDPEAIALWAARTWTADEDVPAAQRPPSPREALGYDTVEATFQHGRLVAYRGVLSATVTAPPPRSTGGEHQRSPQARPRRVRRRAHAPPRPDDDPEPVVLTPLQAVTQQQAAVFLIARALLDRREYDAWLSGLTARVAREHRLRLERDDER